MPPVALFRPNTAIFNHANKRPLCKRKCDKRPGHIVQRPPPYNSWGKRPGAELASHSSERNGAVSEAGKGNNYVVVDLYAANTNSQTCQLVNQSISCPISESKTNKTTNQSTDLSTNRPVSQSTNQLPNQSIDQPNNQPTNQSTELIHQSANQQTTKQSK